MKLQCQNISFSYTKNKFLRISNFELENASNIVWLKGPSGSGKSTFLALLAGLLSPQSGNISWNHVDLSSLLKKEITEFRHQNIGYLHQECKMINHWTVEQNLNLVCASPKIIEEHLALFSLNGNVKKQLVGHLSGGEKQRVNILQILLRNPPIILLDEPTAHLDDRNANALLSLLNERLGKSLIILVSHDNRLEKWIGKSLDFESIRS